jgi:hypothetical protein
MPNPFWNAGQRRPRAAWRLLLFLVVVAAVANPLVLLLDQSGDPLLEGSLENACVAAGFLAALAVAARYSERRPLRDFGLPRGGAGALRVAAGFLLGVAPVGVIVLACHLAGWLSLRETAWTSLPSTAFPLALAGQILRYSAGSLFEEIMSRSYLLRMGAELAHAAGAGRRRAVLMAWCATSFLFGGLHLANPEASLQSALNLSLLGLLFGLPMILTGDLSLSIGLHAGWNVAQNCLFGLPNSGKPSVAAILALDVEGPSLWTGGTFGPEGGLLATIVVAAALLAGFASRRRWSGTGGIVLSLAEPPPLARRSDLR